MPSTPIGPATVLGAVLAGGASRRMGAPKAAMALGGRALIEYPLEAFAQAGIPAVVVAKASTPLPPLDVPIWHDPDEPLHPLSGIVTALRGAGGRAVVVCGCDMPFAGPALLAWLAGRPEPVVVPRVDGRLHPLLARYGSETLGALEAALASAASMRATIAALGAHEVGEAQLARFGDPRRLVANVNTPADHADAAAHLEVASPRRGPRNPG